MNTTISQDTDARTNAIAKVLTWCAAKPNNDWLRRRTEQFVDRTKLDPASCLALMERVRTNEIDQVEFIKAIDEIVDEEFRSHNYPWPLD